MYEQIPKQLKSLRQWVAWVYKVIDGREKPTKIPINPQDGSYAKSDDPDTWGSFEQACEAVTKFKLSGIGIMFAGGLAGVDIDHCVDAQTGEIEEYAKDIIHTVKSYTELSPSGTGIHILCLGTLPEGRRRKGDVEMYCEGRFFTVTGKDFLGMYEFGERTTELAEVHEKYLAEKKEIKTPAPTVAYSAQISESELLERAFASAEGSRIKALYNGAWESLGIGDGSQSSADQAFCNHLAFWFGRDAAAMDAVFRRSGLMRSKWDKLRGEKTYGQKTIERAIMDCPKVYDPEHGKNKKTFSRSPLAPQDNKETSLPIKEFKYNVGHPLSYGLDDTGNANLFRDMFGEDIRYNPVNEAWLYWDGRRWATDESGEIKRYADKMLNKMAHQHAETPELGESYRKHIIKSRSSRGKKAFIEETKHLDGIHIAAGIMDKPQNAFNAKNCVINLQKGTVSEHQRGFMLSQLGGVSYDNTAKCPKWLTFLEDITDGDKELQLFLQRMVGYSLTGSTKEQCVFFLYGNGSNGKSTFVDVMSELMGEYASSCQPETVMMRDKNSAARTDIARLRGCRMVSTYEPNEGSKLDEGIVKQLTGGDKVVARFLYGKEFEFKPEFKILMATNYKPSIKGTDNGIWRRVKLIPFTVSISEDKKDKDLPVKLRNELPGILNWALEGSVGWYKEGLPPCKVIDAAVKEYRHEMDKFEQFADDCLHPVEGGSIQSSVLYKCYVAWCTDQGDRYPTSAAKFSGEMKKRFTLRKTNAFNEYVGVTFSDHGKIISASLDKF